MTGSEAGAAPATDATEGSLGRATGVITFWNLISRLTGFARVLATTAALGVAVLGDTYGRTNQVSNVLFELLAGGMLFSVLVPSFVFELRRGSRQQARHLASALMTRAALALTALVAVGILLRHQILELLSAGARLDSRATQVELGAFLLIFILPQLVLYLIGSFASALLQADGRFAATSFAPVTNNVVVTASMIAFALVHDPADGLHLTLGEKLILGGGTLGGTIAMTIVPLIALRIGDLRIGLRWRLPDVELRPLVRRGIWGAGHIGLNEVLILSTVILAGAVDGGATAYQTAFTFFLLPHALLGHPIFTAFYPKLSQLGADGDRRGFADLLGRGLRAMVFLLLPASAILGVAAVPGLSALRIAQFSGGGARFVSLVLGSYLVGLVGYSTFFLLTRAAYALDDARAPTIVNLGVTAGTVAGMVVATRTWAGIGLIVAFGLVTSFFAVLGSTVLLIRIRRHLGEPVPVLATALRVSIAAVAAAAAALGAAGVIGWDGRLRALMAAAVTVPVGLVTHVVILRLLGESAQLDEWTARIGRLLRPLFRRLDPRTRRRAVQAGGLLLLLLLVAGSLGLDRLRAPNSIDGHREVSNVVVFTIPGLTLDDVGDDLMPTLDRLARNGAIAVTNVKTGSDTPSSGSSHASLSAGNRVGTSSDEPALARASEPLLADVTVRDLVELRGGTVEDDDLVILNLDALDDATNPPGGSPAGSLADAALERGRRVALVSNPDEQADDGRPLVPAALAAADTHGVIRGGSVGPELLTTTVGPDGTEMRTADPAAHAEAVRLAQDEADIVFVDPGETTRAFTRIREREEREADEDDAEDEPAEPTTGDPTRSDDGPDHDETARRDALRHTDTVLDRVHAELRPGTLLFVIGLNQSDWALTPLVAWGPGIPHGYLDSGSTHRPALVTLPDIAPTVLARLGIDPPAEMIGQPLRNRVADATWSEARQLDQLLANRTAIHTTMTVVFIVANAVLYPLALLLLARRRTGRDRVRPWLALAALTCSAWPLATYLLRIGTSTYLQGTATILLSWAIAAVIATLASRLRRHPLDPVLAVAAATVLVLVTDLATGAHLQVGSFFGYMPHTRFIGLGNAGFAILAASTITVIGALLARSGDRETAWWGAVWLSVVVLLTIGAPWMGTDVGGLITLVPVLLVLLTALRGRSVGGRTIVLAGLGAAAILGLAVGIDALRPADERTHIGRFFLEAGRGTTAIDTLRRKWDLNLADVRDLPILWLVPILAIVGIVLVLRHRPLRALLPVGSPIRATVLATITAGIVGWLVNDSGVIVLALGCVFLGPLLIHLTSASPPEDPDRPIPPPERNNLTPPMSTTEPEHRPDPADPDPADPTGDPQPSGAPTPERADGETIVAIVPAKDRADSIARTVEALLALDRVDRVIVVDDGSDDDTADRALTAGATVLRLPHNLGKGAAVLAGVRATPEATIHLLIDADLAATASAADVLLEPVVAGDIDLAIGVLPPAGGRAGFGLVRDLAARGIRSAGGPDTTAPLSGQRAVRSEFIRPIAEAERFGLEVAMTIDVARAGGRIREIPVPMDHRHTGRSLSGFAHRGRQGLDILTALWPRVTTARQRMAMLLLVTILVSVGAVLTGSRSAPGGEIGGAPASKVVVFGLDPYGLRELDDGDTPNLDRLRDEGSLGAMSVRTRVRRSDTAEGFLAIGGTARLHAPADAATFLPADASVGPVDVATHVENLTGTRPSGAFATLGAAALTSANSDAEAAGKPGELARILEANDRSAAFVGSDDRAGYFGDEPVIHRPAALAVMHPDFGADGVVDGLTVDDPTTPFGVRIDPEAVADAVDDQLARHDLVVVDPGELARAAAFRSVAGGRVAADAWDGAVQRTDRALGAILDRVDDDTLVIVVSLSTTDGDYHLQPVLIAGPGVPRGGRIQSPSTKRESLSALTDVAPTILHAFGIPKPSSVPGHALHYEDRAPSMDALRDLDRDTIVREHTYAPQSRWYLRAHQILYVAALVGSLVAALRPRLRWLRPAVLGLASYPVMSFLVRLVPDVSTWFWAQVLLAVGLSAAFGWFAARRRIATDAGLLWVSGLTTAVIVVDTWMGTPLQMSSWLGSSMHNAGRFYGVPNTTFAVLAASSLIWAALRVERSHRRGEAVAQVAAVFLVCLVSAGLPMLGADVGTLLTLTPVYGLVLLALTGRRLDLRHLVVAGSVMGLAVVAAAAADLARPTGSRTHLGNFAQQVLDEGPSAILDSFLRKQSANFRILNGSLWTELVLLAVIVLTVVLVRRGTFARVLPAGSPRRIGFIAVIGAALLGFATNDSGPIVLALFAAQLLAFTILTVIDHDVTEPVLLPPGPPTTASAEVAPPDPSVAPA